MFICLCDLQKQKIVMAKRGQEICISQIDMNTKLRSVVVRILTLWTQKDKKGMQTIEMILVDKDVSNFFLLFPSLNG